MAVAIQAEGLTRVYRGGNHKAPTRAVDGVSLEVEQGTVLGLLGPNGAGKTTMVRMLACLLRPSEGTARICGHDIRQERAAVRAICGISLESPGLYERLSAEEYLGLFGRLYRVPEREIPARVETQLRAAGLWDRRQERLGAFSKGMRQKVNIARALLHRPRVVFLDEPTSGLDVEAARSVRDHLQGMRQEADTTFFVCTHNLPEAERLCNRIAVMNRGRIVASGSPAELKAHLSGGRAVRARLRAMDPRYVEAMRAAPEVATVQVEERDLLLGLAAPEEEANPRLLRQLVALGADVISFASEGRTLEEVYLHLVHQEAEEAAA